MSENVTIYTNPTCGPCRRLKRGLDEAGVVYEEVDINSDARSGAKIEALTGGFKIVPAVEVGELLLINPPVGEVVRAAVSGN
ncbi:MAG TPA: glutaredoxin family protein [Actinomycetota bacterium]|nr:glutaredoxin family protein [Actinomycetota bacterium]